MAADGPVNSPHPALKLRHTLLGHTEVVHRMALSPDGRILASPSADGTVRLWDCETGEALHCLVGHSDIVISAAWSRDGELLASGGDDTTVRLWNSQTGALQQVAFRGHTGRISSIAWRQDSKILASGSSDRTIRLWDPETGSLLRELRGHTESVYGIAFSPDGRRLCSGSWDDSVRLWDAETGGEIRTLAGHKRGVNCVAWSLEGPDIVSGSDDRTVRIWHSETGLQKYVLEGHTDEVVFVSFLDGGRLLASLGESGAVIVWRTDTWAEAMRVKKIGGTDLLSNLAGHPTLPVMAGSGRTRAEINIWDLDFAMLRGAEPATATGFYVNAKVVLVGDTGVGKSGLSLVLNGKPFEPTDSTPGRHVWTLGLSEAELPGNRKQNREMLLWDLAGQPGYRIIHQLHLNEIAVALVVFDSRSETDPLAGVRHWERALRVAHQRQGAQAVPIVKFLVSARADRGGVSVSKDRLDALIKEFGFAGYFECSAKEGWQIQELKTAIERAIPWGDLPVVTSSELFASIKAFLLSAKDTGHLLAQAGELFHEFERTDPEVAAKEQNLRAQFDTCIGRLENRDLIRSLSFGGYVLLQPELLDAYASAMVNAAKNEPDGLGSIAEDMALAGRFLVPEEQRVKDKNQEQLLLHATIEELVAHDLALRESAADGRYLVFPSQFNRDYEDAPEPPGKTVAITFEGPVQSLYSTLAVRLGHSGLFETGRVEMWRNAAVFTARAGGKCGLYLHEFAEARGRLLLFFDPQASDETRFHFEEYALSHLSRGALASSVEVVRFFVCSQCGNPVPDAYVSMLRQKDQKDFPCPCGRVVSLAEPKERLAKEFPSQVEAMDKAADRRRDFEAYVVSAKAETHTRKFEEWAGGERVILAIVFTDVVGSTATREEIKDESMGKVLRAHFAQSRELITKFKGREIKTIGDSFMVAFHSADAAFDYAQALQSKPGHATVQIRAGIHVGAMQVEESDVFGSTVNFAARVVGEIEGAEIWLSDDAKAHIDGLGAERHKNLKWERHEATMKGFQGTFVLWSLVHE
jgi:class 3 adenylate cyclase/GTPase SAR1 family protein